MSVKCENAKSVSNVGNLPSLHDFITRSVPNEDESRSGTTRSQKQCALGVDCDAQTVTVIEGTRCLDGHLLGTPTVDTSSIISADWKPYWNQ